MAIGNRLKIRTKSCLPSDWQVELEGVDISHGLTGVTLRLRARELTHVEIGLHVDHLDIDAETLGVLEAHVRTQEESAA